MSTKSMLAQDIPIDGEVSSPVFDLELAAMNGAFACMCPT